MSDPIEDKLKCVLRIFPNHEDKFEKIMKYYVENEGLVNAKAKQLRKQCFPQTGGGKRKKRETKKRRKKRRKGKTRRRKLGRKIKSGGDKMAPELEPLFNLMSVVFVLLVGYYHIFPPRR